MNNLIPEVRNLPNEEETKFFSTLEKKYSKGKHDWSGQIGEGFNKEDIKMGYNE